ncbi:DUF1254 domain-containing protein [Thalassotalea psychrophila]|uniref:DUF1254 domain-containing protein n=1 Tax=Thalassotalea psychrophila TaxID=3065647 RepID=A0ABY9TYH4_9GAMM|nr:DUF1254 domain-containing protein [Colwelliaceae bacterium SQ149]
MKKSFKTSLIAFALTSVLAACSQTTDTSTVTMAAATSQFIEVTDANFAHAETARNYRNWVALGANKQITHMRNLPPRGKDAPTVQMNDDTLYSVVIAEAENGHIKFSIPKTDVYLAVQVVTEGGHGQQYVVGEGDYDLPVETDFAFLIYRTGVEKGIEAARAAQDKISDDTFKFNTYSVQNYNYDEVEEWVSKLTAETQGAVFTYTFPRTSDGITDRHQWNLENANGWGGSSPEVNVANLYSNSVMLDGSKCLSTTFEDPESKYFTSITPYDSARYLMPGVKHVSSNTWTVNSDKTVTVSFNCGADAVNNIDTKGLDFSFTMRYYGVSQKVIDGKINPEKTVK